jgi:hypothetical protein
MALSQTAIDRRRIILDWARQAIDDRDFRMLHATSGRTPGGLLHRRLLMLVAQAGIPDVDSIHILDSDENWEVFRFETKITAGYYYAHADVSARNRTDDTSWGPVMYSNRRSMERYFYRTLIDHSGTQILLKPEAYHLPEVTGGFPKFEHFHSDPNLSYPEKVYEMLGLVGGNLPFSSNTSLKSVKFHFGNSAVTWDVTSTNNRIDFYWVAQGIRIEVELNDRNARVEYKNQTQRFLDDGTDLTFNIKVIAEDNSEQLYEWVIVDS